MSVERGRGSCACRKSGVENDRMLDYRSWRNVPMEAKGLVRNLSKVLKLEKYSPQWVENTCGISCLPDPSYSLKL
jgi:hypothetical protein